MRLRELRTSLGLTQKKMAEAIGCTQSVYMRYEKGLRHPPSDILLRMVEAYNVSADYLLGRDIPEESLNTYEVALIAAARGADERAREDALLLLQQHKVD